MKVNYPGWAWVVYDEDRDEATPICFAPTRDEAEKLWNYADEIAPRGELSLWEVTDIGFVGINRPDVKPERDIRDASERSARTQQAIESENRE